jgi:NAD(P)-dependent dehydrogenase (short-subunit alcohol dehydrogenase family)
MNRKDPSAAGASRGLIICTASNAGLYPFPIAPLYATSKYGVIGLVRSLAKPLAKHGIQINALAPAVLGKSKSNFSPQSQMVDKI